MMYHDSIFVSTALQITVILIFFMNYIYIYIYIYIYLKIKPICNLDLCCFMSQCKKKEKENT